MKIKKVKYFGVVFLSDRYLQVFFSGSNIFVLLRTAYHVAQHPYIQSFQIRLA